MVTMVNVIALLVFALLLLILWTFCQLNKGICKFSGHMVGKVVIVTGANTGIGFETAKDLAQRGALVIAACRNEEKGKNAVYQIIESSRNNNVRFIQLDLASFASIKKFVEEVMGMVSHVDVLINNAGVYATTNEKTEDGFLVGMQVNYLGPFLLTSLLLPILKSSAPSRIINVSSTVYRFGTTNFFNFESMRKFRNFTVYSTAKLFIMFMTIELDRQLQGTGVTVNCLHPGVVDTNMIDNIDIRFFKIILKILKSFYKNSWEGAQTTIYLSVSPDVKDISGHYFKDCRVANLTSKAQNLKEAKKVWDISEKLVKLK